MNDLEQFIELVNDLSDRLINDAEVRGRPMLRSRKATRRLDKERLRQLISNWLWAFTGPNGVREDEDDSATGDRGEA